MAHGSDLSTGDFSTVWGRYGWKTAFCSIGYGVGRGMLCAFREGAAIVPINGGAEMEKSHGQSIVDRMVAFILRYSVMPEGLDDQALVAALWAIHTWIFNLVGFPATPYLSIQSSTKGAGKTIFMEVIGMLSQNYHQAATLRPLGLLRVIKAFNQACTLGIDEAEKLGSAAIGDLRSIFTSGAYPGGNHIITSGKEFVSYPTYCPKMFALIGEVMDVVRDRSILLWLRRAMPVRDFRAERGIATVDAGEIVKDLRSYLRGREFQLIMPEFFGGREREIWSAVFSVAQLMDLDKATMARLQRIAVDLSGLKTDEGRHIMAARTAAAHDNAIDAEKLLRDVAACFPEPTAHRSGDLFTVTLLDALKAIPTAPWRTYRGEGLTPDLLSALLGVFGVGPEPVRELKADKKRGIVAKQLNGYRRAKVLKALEVLGR